MRTPVERSRLVLRDVDYIGAHPAAPEDLSGIDIAFEDEGVTFTRRKQQLGVIAWPDVKGLSAFSATVPARVSLPGVLFFGVLAFLFERRGRQVLLRIEDQQGDWLFEVRGIDVDDLRGGLTMIRNRHDV